MPPETRTCPVCWTQFTATGRRTCCSKKCRRTAWERRGRRQARQATPRQHTQPQPRPAARGHHRLPALRPADHHRRAADHPASSPAASAGHHPPPSSPADMITARLGKMI